VIEKNHIFNSKTDNFLLSTFHNSVAMKYSFRFAFAKKK